MNIVLDGINSHEQQNLKNIITDMVKKVFGETKSNIKEISIPINFRDVVNSKHRIKFPNQEYIPKNNNTTIAKNFRIDNNYSEIILNNILYMKDKELFFSTLYHEIVHAKFYYDINIYDYFKICVEDAVENEDCMIGVYTFKVIDEYNAYKKTFELFPEVIYKYIQYSYNLDLYFIQLENYNYDWFEDVIDYMNKMTSCLSIVFALFDVDVKLLNSYKIKNNTFKYIYELYKILDSLKNNIPDNEEFVILKNQILDIFNLVNWEE